MYIESVPDTTSATILRAGDDPAIIDATEQSTSDHQETLASSLTSGGMADIDIEGNTHLSGSLLATVDAQGNDLGQLNLTTGSLSYDPCAIGLLASKSQSAPGRRPSCSRSMEEARKVGIGFLGD